jgi:L-ribulose-5-phosphate 4-epimerase
MLKELREQVCGLLKELPKHKLVCLTSGNISARDPQSGLVVIKPSGVPYEDLASEMLAVIEPGGKKVWGEYMPSSDTASHLYIYSQMDDIHGIVHTHSPYATAFAAAGLPIPVLFSETAEEFGGEISCSDFVLIGDEAIGEQVVRYGQKTHAVVLKKHGIFTIGTTPRKALDLAILAENSARIAWLGKALGANEEIPAEEIQKLYYRQQNVYGQ